MKIYKKKIEGDPINYIRFDSCYPDLDVHKFVVMMSNLDVRTKWDERSKKMNLIGRVSNSEIVHTLMDLPFPLTNREQVTRRFIFSNKIHPEFFKKYNLPTDVPAYLIVA